MVYGRPYAEKRVGPYARLFVYGPGEEVIREGDAGGNTFYILIEGRLDVYVKDDQGVNRKCGEVEAQNSFGEMSVLAGQPRNETVVVPAGTEATVLAIQRPALRLLRKLKKFGDRLERNYRQHGLDRTLIEFQEATHQAFSAELLEKLKTAARFTVYPKDHVLFQQGERIDKLVFINNGWVRRVRGITSDAKATPALSAMPKLGERVTELDDDIGFDFLGAGNWLGLETIPAGKTEWDYAATVMSRTEALEISVANLGSEPDLVEAIRQTFPSFSAVDDNPPTP